MRGVAACAHLFAAGLSSKQEAAAAHGALRVSATSCWQDCEAITFFFSVHCLGSDYTPVMISEYRHLHSTRPAASPLHGGVGCVRVRIGLLHCYFVCTTSRQLRQYWASARVHVTGTLPIFPAATAASLPCLAPFPVNKRPLAFCVHGFSWLSTCQTGWRRAIGAGLHCGCSLDAGCSTCTHKGPALHS